MAQCLCVGTSPLPSRVRSFKGRLNPTSGCFRLPFCNYFVPSVFSVGCVLRDLAKPSQERSRRPAATVGSPFDKGSLTQQSFVCHFPRQRMQDATGSRSCNRSATSEGSGPEVAFASPSSEGEVATGTRRADASIDKCMITTRKLCYRKDYRAMRLILTIQSDNTHMVCC